MDSLTLFDQNISITVILIAVVVLTMLIFAIVLYRRKGKAASDEPKTGFLGKPLLQFGLLVIMAGAIVAGVYLTTTQESDVTTQAGEDIDLIVNYQKDKEYNQKTEVFLKAIPVVKGKEWGEKNQEFDFIWNFKAVTNLDKVTTQITNYVEKAKTKDDPSGFTASLANAKYEVEVTVSFGPEVYSETFELDLR